MTANATRIDTHISPQARILLQDRQDNLPVWVRAPKIGTEHYTGLTRSKLYDLAAKDRIKSASIREPGQVRGTRLFHLGSILNYLDSLPSSEESSKPSPEQIAIEIMQCESRLKELSQQTLSAEALKEIRSVTSKLEELKEIHSEVANNGQSERQGI